MRYQWEIPVKCWPISIAISLDSGEHCRRDRPALFTKPRHEATILDFGPSEPLRTVLSLCPLRRCVVVPAPCLELNLAIEGFTPQPITLPNRSAL